MFNKEKVYTQAEVDVLLDQAIAYTTAHMQGAPSPVEYDVAMLRQYALFQAMNYNVQIAAGRQAPSMEQVIIDAAKILEYLGHGTELTPSLAAYQGILSAQQKQASAQTTGYV